jgi:TolB-like protein
MDKRIVKKKSNTKKNVNSNDKSPEVKSTQETKSTSNIQNAKNKSIINDEKLSTVEMPFSDQSYIENESITTDEILEDEIKELEKEEENIILLMDKIKQLNQNV